MRRAILHIGTEKTGSTSIQQFLYKNRRLLAAEAYLFPASCDYPSHRSLVLQAMHEPDIGLARGRIDLARSDGFDEWREGFLKAHCLEVSAFQSAQAGDSTVIYSSEHLHSRLRSVPEIARVEALLRPLYDRIEVIVYLRRQDWLALSAHSTRLRAGFVGRFDLAQFGPGNRYFDHRRLLQEWSDVFGAESLIVRVFERDRLAGGDVVKDFCQQVDVPWQGPGFVHPAPVNEALSQTAEALLLRFNERVMTDHVSLTGLHPGALRQQLIRHLEKLTDGHGRWLPARREAVAFMQSHEDANREVAERFLDGKGFNRCFDAFPVEPQDPAEIAEIDTRLDTLIECCRNTLVSQRRSPLHDLFSRVASR